LPLHFLGQLSFFDFHGLMQPEQKSELHELHSKLSITIIAQIAQTKWLALSFFLLSSSTRFAMSRLLSCSSIF